MKTKATFWIVQLALTLGLLLPYSPTKADEGMWLPLMLKQLIGDMKAKGFKLSAEDIYSVNQSSMKDAVIWFGRGCTGEVVSDQGLILTNHHCGYGQIQSHSTVENDYLTEGFWAMDRSEELPNPGLTVTFIVRIDDVTDQVLAGVTDEMDEMERNALIERNMAKAKENATAGTHYEALLKDFYYGNEYYLFLTETFKDIRLVGAPPSSIGKYGGDTDNWMWPRHTGDFSLFRIYAGPDNKPADYAPDNVPFKPRHHFPISLAPVQEDDFAMIFGFPGTTQHFLHSEAVRYVQETSNPVKIAMREASLGVMDGFMAADDKVRIQYAARYARISNYYKKWQGENTGLKRLNTIAEKQAFERTFKARANSKMPKAATIPDQLSKHYQELAAYNLARDLYIELVYYGPQDLRFALDFIELAANFKQLKKEKKLKPMLEKLKPAAAKHFKDYHRPLEQQVFAQLLEMYLQHVDADFHPRIAVTAKNEFNNDFTALAKQVYSTSVMASEEKLMAMLQSFDAQAAEELMSDPMIQLAADLNGTYFMKVAPSYGSIQGEIDKLMRRYVQAQKTLFPEKTHWPDANSTLRLSYGSVTGSAPRDGMMYRHYTTLEGVMQKRKEEVPKTHEFYVHDKLVELYQNKDYGAYAQDGELWVCFTASHHTTGGNSGSPVIGDKGQLLGINFDRSWESTMSDLHYDPDRCRNIIVDIRYVLFVIDKYAGAKHLVDEMTILQ